MLWASRAIRAAQQSNSNAEAPTLLGVGAIALIILLASDVAKRVYELDRLIGAFPQKMRLSITLHTDIDESKHQAEVVEIVESDFFKDLQQKAQHIRDKSTTSQPEIVESDYFDYLQQKAQQIRDKSTTSQPDRQVTEIFKSLKRLGLRDIRQPRNSSQIVNIVETEYFQDLQKRAKKLRGQSNLQQNIPEEATNKDPTDTEENPLIQSARGER